MKMIFYKKGFKYQLNETYVVQTNVKPGSFCHDGFLTLKVDGLLTIGAGYAWDGPSGPAFDTKNFMRASLVHDALYQLIRANELGRKFRGQSDKELRVICREDGMSWLRAFWCYWGVFIAAESASDPKNVKKIYTAP
ncbi:hypothetical protein KAR91_56490 [Candidatus Pacearchaeota archaeon]|nr:hypothetical protein [Candidatus Pacearchaeota archaeon]